MQCELLEPIFSDLQEVRLRAAFNDAADGRGAIYMRDVTGKLKWTSPRAMLLSAVGLATGILSGMFGVGGGFIIVPALIAFSCMSMKRAISTSLLVMTLVSASGVTSHIIAGRPMALQIAALFSVGSLIGLLIGSQLAQQLTGAGCSVSSRRPSWSSL